MRVIRERFLSSNEIIDLFDKKNIDNEWSFEGVKPSQTGKWTHDFHRYPAKFIPQLVEKLFDEYINSNNAHINDPFIGSGTTIATAISKGFMASGTDINKIAYFISRVKSTPIKPDYLLKKISKIITKLSFLENNSNIGFYNIIEPLIPAQHIERINYWFTPENKLELGIILRAINEEEDQHVKDFFLVAFSNILKNCSIWLQTSTKPTRDFNKISAKPFTAFNKQLKKMQRGNEAFYHVVPSRVTENIDKFLEIKIGDARQQPVQNDSVDLIVTSSPYVTSYEYADLHQLSTIWLDFTYNLNKYKREFIGTSYKEYNGKILKSKIAQNIVNQMESTDKKMSKKIEAFFIDIQEVFDESYRILKIGGRCCYVIGDTRLKGIDILNAEVFAESIQFSGFRLDRIIKREIPSKILPQKRDKKTGQFASNDNANSEAYPIEYIVIGIKE
jgi:DNA modification methylase